MPQAISIHLGLNSMSAAVYGEGAPALRGCENDARAMQGIAAAQGFEARLLLGAAATRAAALAALDGAAAALGAGDLLLLTFSGHGGWRRDTGGDEPDGRDELWCLHDGLLLDDEIHARLCGFGAGVRVLVVSDSCFSGSVIRNDPRAAPAARVRRGAPPRDGRAVGAARRLSEAQVRAVWRARAAEYEERSAAVAPRRAEAPAASVVLLAACDDRETARDGDVNGLFTAALLEVWVGGAFTGGHGAFLAAIQIRVGAAQTPTLLQVGATDRAFLAARPFTP